VRETTRGIP